MNRSIPVLVCLIIAAGVCHAAQLRAAANAVDITPPPNTPMWGYAARNGPSTGTLDPLMARVLVLEAGPKRIAIVTLDLGRCFGEAAVRQVRDAAHRSSGVSYVFMTASHTHAGPVILDEYPQKPEWETGALLRIEQAIADAAAHLKDARIGAGYGIAYIGHNRLRLHQDRSVVWMDRNPEKLPTSPVDPTVAVLRVDDSDGSPIAILVNYACHPVVFGPDNRQFSADYPGAMARTIQDGLGSGVTAMFVQGGAGDINPYYAVTPLEQDAVKRKDWTGETLGKEVVRVAKTIRAAGTSDASLDFVEDPLDFRLRWDPEKFRQGMAKIFGGDFESQFGPPVREHMQLPVSSVLINKEFAIVGLPGEPFVDLQTNWRSRSPLPYTFFAGYANGYHGYFPTIEGATYAGYGTASVTTWVEPDAGERMVEHAVVQINTLLGRLTNVPFEAPY